MKFSVTKEKLLECLQQVQNVVSTRTTLPILSNVLLQTNGSEVRLTTTDLDVGVRGSFEAQVEKEGATTLPARTVGFAGAAYYTRLTRVTMLEELNRDYVRTARAKGLPESSVNWKHAFRNAVGPILTQIGLDFGFFLGGVVVVEQIFSWPGIGKLAVDSIRTADVPLIMGTVLFATLCIVLANLTVDIANAIVDPRIRF